jgi:predicted alpha/beta hydrolase family esterase
MARRILFVQGGGETTYDDWDSKLVGSLERALGPGYEIRYPRMPDEGDPNFERWKAVLGEEIDGLGDGAVLVGHSIGATILVHSLAEAPPARPPVGIFLVAPPFVGEGGWPMDEIAPKPDLGARLPAGAAVFLYLGGADDTVPPEHADLYARAIPQVVVRHLPGRDHQLDDDLSEIAADIRGLFTRDP